jgi:ubiquinone/menaquinone biosynthesis C-methylase UbiE
MKAELFYDASYYQSHYGHLQNERYYEMLSSYWKHTIFDKNGLSVHKTVLDYGCGLGQVSASLSKTSFFDTSEVALDFLRSQGKPVFSETNSIPQQHFDYLLSSHSLEHYTNPADALGEFRNYLKESGKLILILPIEKANKVALDPDSDRHFYTWTFQNITNLLNYTGWKPLKQSYLYGPFMLRRMSSVFKKDTTVKFASYLGRWMNSYPATLTIAEKVDRSI